MKAARRISPSTEPLAIVGVGCRVSGASGPNELWSLLRRGGDSVGPRPSRGWGDIYDPDPFAKGKSVSLSGSFLDDVEGVDWRFFGISPREARSIDPQHRLLLEVAWETLEDAGLTVAQAAGSRAGVFAGIMLNDYGRLYGRDLGAIDGYTTQNNTFAYAANRISFFFDLRGPSIAIDTNCSSSLLAFHQACRSVATGEADWALAGGVSLILAPDADISMSKATALSPTGRVRTWDSKADGFVRGEGAGLVLVKPLASALADGDRIYALVLGTAANHKGRGNWIVEPSSEAQQDVIRTACAMAGIEPEAMDYVELHGTGTPKGDPVEADALGTVMTARPATRPCRVGSIKTNLGHLDAAAGVLGLIKTALCIRSRELVPSLHFEQANPAIDLDRLKLRVQTTTEPWPRPDVPATAGVTSIGFGGTNVHAVLRGLDATSAVRTAPDAPSYVLPLSARSDGALSSLAGRFADWFEGGGSPCPALGDIAYTVGARRSHHDVRLAVAGDSPKALGARLRDFLRGDRAAVAFGARVSDRLPRVVFVFPGHGPQWLGMARDLVHGDAAFAGALAACDGLVHRESGWSVIDALFAEPGASRLEDPEVVQPVLFSIQVALAALWRSWGVVPDVVVGHSFGEIAAAVVAGAIAIEEGVRVVCARGRLTQRRAGHGGVAIVELPLETVETLLLAYPTLEVGGETSPTTTIVTGGLAQLEALVGALTGRDVFARRVKLGYASHSRDMDGLLDDFAAAIGPLKTRPTQARFCSTVHGGFVEGATLDADYWVRNLRAPVRFADAMRSIGGTAPSVFLEIGPHPVLTTALKQNLDGGSGVLAVLPSLQRGRSSLTTLDDSLGRLYAAGCDLDWGGRYPNGTVVSTPTYAWQHERMWIDVAGGEGGETSHKREHPLLGRRVENADSRTLVWEQTIGGPETAYFRDHLLQGVPSASTSAMVEMVVAAASRTLGTEALELFDIELRRALVLPREGTYRVQTLLTHGSEWTAEVRGRADTPDSPWRTHATANVRLAAAVPDAPRFERPLSTRLTRDEAYRELGSRGLQYGPTFQGIEWLSREGEGVLACVRMPEGLDPQPYFFHPAMHDAAMHVAVLAEVCQGHSGILPVRIGRIWIHSRPAAVLRTHACVRQTVGGIRADLRVESADGGLVEIIEGIELAHLDDAIVADDIASEEASWLYNVEWTELRHPPASKPPAWAGDKPGESACWLVLADRRGVGAALVERIRATGLEAIVVTSDAFEQGRRPADSGDAQRDLLRVVASSVRPGVSLAGVVHLWTLDLPDVETIEPDRIDAARHASCDSAHRLLGALDEALPTAPTPVWFVTRGAHAWALAASQMAPLHAPVWGIARAAAAELPSRWGGLVDLDPAVSADDSATKLWAWLTGPRDGEDEVVFRHGETYGGRLVRRPVEQARRPLEFRPDASYLVTGGTGGLGLAVARWLATRGAKNLVLAARTPLPPREAWATLPRESPFAEQVDALVAIENLGATAHLVSLDVADHAAVIEFINDHERKGRPSIRGVFHLAGTVHIEDTLSLDAERLLKTMRPKVHGTVALHRWLEDLDFFVLFSSASSVIRSPRMGHYAAGNAFLDAMAHYRRARGHSAISIDWGLWSDIGFIRQLGTRGPDAMAAMKSIPPDSGIRILERLAEDGDVQAIVWPPDWEHWARMYPTFARTSLIAHLLGPREARRVEPARTTIPSVWSEVPEADRAQALRELVTREIAVQLRLGIEDLPLDTPLERLGFDSLLATELQARFIADLAVQIPILRLLGFATARTIADEVAAGIRESERRLKASPPVSNEPSQAASHDPNPLRRAGS